MKYPKLRFIFNRKKTASKNKTAAVVAYINHEGKRKFYATNVDLYADQWHDVLGVIKRIDASILNERLNSILKKFNSYISELSEKQTPFNFEGYERYLNQRAVKDGSFVDFLENAINSRHDIRESTKRGQRRVVNALRRYQKINSFADLSVESLMDFDGWLHKSRDYKQSAVFYYHRVLHTYINRALQLEYIQKDPYKYFKVSSGHEQMIKYLTEDELEKIKNLSIREKSYTHARDLFVFQAYTGLSYSDLVKFDYSKVEEQTSKKGNKMYVFKGVRTKTNTHYVTLIMKPAMAILKKYDYKLPIISNQKYNAYLKEVAARAEISITLTTHVARHTFATLCLNRGININALAKALGHVKVTTTQIYARISDSTVQNELSNLDDTLGE